MLHIFTEVGVREVGHVDGDPQACGIGNDVHRLVHVQTSLRGGIPVIIAVGRVLGAVFHCVLEGGDRTQVQESQLIVVAEKLRQGGVFAHVQRRQLIARAGKAFQGSVFAHVKRCQLITVAVKLFQGGEVLHAFQVRNVFSVAAHRCDRRQLRRAQIAVAVFVILLHIFTEVGVREVGRVDGHVSRVGCCGGGGESRGQQTANQSQGQKQGKYSFHVLFLLFVGFHSQVSSGDGCFG